MSQKINGLEDLPDHRPKKVSAFYFSNINFYYLFVFTGRYYTLLLVYFFFDLVFISSQKYQSLISHIQRYNFSLTNKNGCYIRLII